MWAALEAAQIADLVRSLPDGLDTVVGERGYRLSGGERQRLAIARLLLKAPPIVVLDEATAHLDSESEAAVQRALDLAHGGPDQHRHRPPALHHPQRRPDPGRRPGPDRPARPARRPAGARAASTPSSTAPSSPDRGPGRRRPGGAPDAHADQVPPRPRPTSSGRRAAPTRSPELVGVVVEGVRTHGHQVDHRRPVQVIGEARHRRVRHRLKRLGRVAASRSLLVGLDLQQTERRPQLGQVVGLRGDHHQQHRPVAAPGRTRPGSGARRRPAPRRPPRRRAAGRPRRRPPPRPSRRVGPGGPPGGGDARCPAPRRGRPAPSEQLRPGSSRCPRRPRAPRGAAAGDSGRRTVCASGVGHRAVVRRRPGTGPGRPPSRRCRRCRGGPARAG